MSTKTQPEEHEVLAEINKVLATNPDFGVKRVSVVLKEQNPEWTLSEKRVTKLLKKHKSVKITLDGDSDSTDSNSPSAAAAAASSPWNVTPAAAPAAHDPWNTTPVVAAATSGFTAATQTAAKAVAPVVSAFNVEPVAEPVPAAAAHNPWNAAPVHDKTFTETLKENVTTAGKKVKETTSDVVAATPGFVEKAKHKAADVVDDVKDAASDAKKDAPGFFEKVKDTTSDAVKDATAAAPSPWNAAPVETPVFVAEPVKDIVLPVAAPVVVDEPKKEAWNFTPVKEEAAKVAEDLKEGTKKAESFAGSAVEKIEAAASVAAGKIKEESAAAVVVVKKAESTVEDKLAEAKLAAENLVGAGYEKASVVANKDKSSRPSTEKDVEGSACGACTNGCSVM